jgi:hypothetical protein
VPGNLGFERRARSNESIPFLTFEDWSGADRDDMASITSEGVTLHATVVERMARLSARSVTGHEF